MLLHRISSILLFITCFSLWAQKEAENWIFGQNAGISFATGKAVNISSSAIAMNTIEGCASISDTNGNLLFYVGASDHAENNLSIWIPYDNDNDGKHDLMPNANNSLTGHLSATQAAIIVPYPGQSEKYFVFTVDRNFAGRSSPRGINYSIIDMTLNGGLGDVMPNYKNKEIINHASEKISAVKIPGEQAYWVSTIAPIIIISHLHYLYHSNRFYSFKIDSTGISDTAVVSTIPVVKGERGYLKFSPDATKIANADDGDNKVILYGFNANTGALTGTPTNIMLPSGQPYGIVFSNDNSKLYITICKS